MKLGKKALSFLLSVIMVLGVCAAGIIAYAGPAAGWEYDLKGLNPDNATVKPTLTISNETISLAEAKANPTRDVTITVKGAADKYASTGLHIQYDSRLTVVTKSVAGKTIYANLGNAGEYLFQEQQGYGDNGFFLATAASDDVGQDGILWKFQLTLPENVKSGDTFPIEIAYYSRPTAEDLFTNCDKDEQGQLMQAYVFTRGINQGYIKIAEPDSTITVNSDPPAGGVVLGGGPYTPGTQATVTATPAQGYHFVSWTEDNNTVSTDSSYSFNVDADRSLVAKFEKDSHTITFVNDDGSVLQSSPVPYGDTPVYSGDTPEKESTSEYAYSFAGWSPEIKKVTADTTYTAVYTSTLCEYDITFVNEDGSVLQSSPVPYGDKPVYSGDTPAKESTPEYTYSFAGWSPEIKEVTADTTYTATYNSIPVDYKLTWVIDEENYKNETIPFGSNITAPEVAAKDGYTFEWVDEIPAAMPAQDVTINGKYTAIKYTATFVDENEKTVDTRDYTVETESITPPEVPVKEGYTGEWEEYKLTIGGITVKPVYTEIPAEEPDEPETPAEELPAEPVAITGNRSKNLGYKENQTFTADVSGLPEGAEVHWFVNGEDAATGSEYKVVGPKDDYTIQAKIIDKDGNVLSESAEESIKVKHGFLDKILFFFAYILKVLMFPFGYLESNS